MEQVSAEFETSMSIPLDSDGFIRRECPTCERDLKWKWLDEEAGEQQAEPEEGGFYCPYCAIQAPSAAWLTKAQAEKAKSILMEQFVGPELDEFGRSLERMNRPGGLVSVSFKRDQPEPADELTEIDDMRRVDFSCHPGASVKVLDDWSREVHCPVCASTVEPGLFAAGLTAAFSAALGSSSRRSKVRGLVAKLTRSTTVARASPPRDLRYR
jgi:hypothetical protein